MDCPLRRHPEENGKADKKDGKGGGEDDNADEERPGLHCNLCGAKIWHGGILGPHKHRYCRCCSRKIRRRPAKKVMKAKRKGVVRMAEIGREDEEDEEAERGGEDEEEFEECK
ncbi:hypothetical protein BU16DRAFT_568059 [Lophium mytilinum]|uniref:Uncharacterized protein n=1 Tax=Lophium mytilinum TaxID=390894 RepID=A0A6A6Q9J2_9PEZI|nr:hypothetical protein BU16DRAFT_568059 [Lophium mytilinum]